MAVSWFDNYIDRQNISKDDQIQNSGDYKLPPIVKPEDDYERDIEGKSVNVKKTFSHVKRSQDKIRKNKILAKNPSLVQLQDKLS